MTIRIRAKNFQSIEDAEIVVDGLTVVTGQNNSGKTALMRAVNGVFTNAPSTAFLRHGTEQLSVSIDFGDAHVVWEKGTKIKPTYRINGKTLHPGREIPKEVMDVGIQSINAGSSSVWPQIAPQFSGTLFLLDQSGSAIAEAVADVERVGTLTNALKLAESDKRSANADLKVRRKDQTQAETEANAFEALADAEHIMSMVVEQHQQVSSISREVAQLEMIRERLTQEQCTVEKCGWVQEIHLPSEPSDIHNLINQITHAISLKDRYNLRKNDVQALAGIENVPVPVVDQGIADTIRDIARLQDILVRLDKAKVEVSKATKMLAAINQQHIDGLDADISKLNKIKTLFGSVIPLSDRIRTTKNQIDNESKSMETSKIQLDQIELEVQELLAEIGVCPTCGSAHKEPHSV